MMTRREWLTRVLGATVAATVAPLLDLTDTTPEFWNQPALRKLMPWRITFPDGVTYSFDATVIAEKILDDGSIDFTLRPTGPMKASQEISFPINYVDSPGKRITEQALEISGEAVPSIHAPATVVTVEDGSMIELKEITLPELIRSENDDLDLTIGLKKWGEVTITVTPYTAHRVKALRDE